MLGTGLTVNVEDVLNKLHNHEAEVGVIGGILLSPSQWLNVSDIITGEDFAHEPYGLIFEAMRGVSDSKRPIDILLLKAELTKRGQLEQIGGVKGLAALTDTVPTGAHIEHYAGIVLEFSQRRGLVSAADSIKSDAGDRDTAPDDAVERAERAVFAISERGASDCVTPISQLLTEQLDLIIKQKETGVAATGLTWGFGEIDDATTGMHEGELIIIAARPSMGKSTFALNMLRKIAAEDHSVILFSLEMAKRNLTANLTAAQARLSGQKLRTMLLDDYEMGKLVKGTEELNEMQIFIDDTPGISLGQLRARARRAKRRHNIAAIFIDYLQLMTVGDRKNKSREQQVSEVSRGLKGLSKELGIPVIALAQLNRGTENRKDPRPTISDLRESGAIEQDADIVALLHRPDYYGAVDPKKMGITEFIIGKQRNGATKDIELTFNGEQFRMESVNNYGKDEF